MTTSTCSRYLDNVHCVRDAMDVEITSRIGLKSLSTPSSTALWVQAARLMPLLLTAQTLMVADGRPRTLLSVGRAQQEGPAPSR
jgi:hypothetical protein